LYSILANIFMSDPETKFIFEKAFLAFLRRIGVQLTDNHPVFGDVKKLVTKKFVEQGWLAIRKVTNENGGDDVCLYAWGWRSLLVLSREDVLNFASNLTGTNHNGYVWSGQREIAQREDARIAETRGVGLQHRERERR